jgi:proton-dependent oligopeptide transporter, POT family
VDNKGEINNPIKHHIALPYLFFTEMWERFSYYGMRALLVLYLTKYFHFTDLEAGKVYGVYTGLVYLTPIFGGYLSDKFLGSRNSIFIGGICMMIGHLTLAFDSISALYLGLFFLIIGNGFFKPNISTLVGKLYNDREGLRDSAFTIFYMGINIGGSLGPLFCGYIGEVYGWHYGFSLAAVGMGFGLFVFYKSLSKLGNLGNSPERPMNVIVQKQSKITNIEIKKIFLLVFLAIMSIFFWVPYEQMGTSVNLFTDRAVDRNIYSINIPASVFQSVNGFLILFFAPIFAFIWQKLAINKMEPNVPTKFAMGFIFLGISYLILLNSSSGDKVPVIYLFLYYILLTIGELCVSPVGLSTVTKLAPEKFASSLMGVWFLSNAISHYISGWLSGAYSQWMELNQLFLFLGITSILSGLFLISILPFIKKYFPD